MKTWNLHFPTHILIGLQLMYRGVILITHKGTFRSVKNDFQLKFRPRLEDIIDQKKPKSV
jgi:hypothetical protein